MPQFQVLSKLRNFSVLAQVQVQDMQYCSQKLTYAIDACSVKYLKIEMNETSRSHAQTNKVNFFIHIFLHGNFFKKI